VHVGWPVSGESTDFRFWGRSWEFCFLLVEMAKNVRRFQGFVPKGHLVNFSREGVMLIGVVIGSYHEFQFRRVEDGAGLFFRSSRELPIHVDLLLFAIISGRNVIPDSRQVGLLRFEVGQPLDLCGGEGKAELVVFIAQKPPSFVTAIVLNGTQYASPANGFVNLNPSFDGELLLRESLALLDSLESLGKGRGGGGFFCLPFQYRICMKPR